MTFQAPKGVSEYLPPRGALFEEVREAFAESARRACYGPVETAVFEDTALFVRGVGESSDVVRKEMYSFTDRGDREITLRPEFTAGVLRAVLEHNLHRGALPVKVFTSGPAFRYERPQAGRYRQFYQFDLEAIGTEDPVADAETIAVAWDAYQSLGLRQYTVLLNSLGDKNCRPAYREALQRFLRGLDLDSGTRLRIEINPLRVLDDKRPQVRAQTQDAPAMTDYLCADCKAHHDTVRRLLAELGVPFADAPRLVRGLDYYTRTTYEFDHAPPAACQVFGVPLGADAHPDILTLITGLRRAGVHADMAFGARGLKGAMKAADRSGADYAVLIGTDERRNGTVRIKDLKTGDQLDVAATSATDWLIERLATEGLRDEP